MKNKEQICVKLTQNNIKKVYRALKMFPMENLSPVVENIFLSGELDGVNTHIGIYIDGTWRGGNLENFSSHTAVKPRELRNILFAEHCKEGDYVVCRNVHYGDLNSNFIMKFTKSDFQKDQDGDYQIYCSKLYNVHDKKHTKNDWMQGYFLRYATQEEIELLEWKKQTYRKQEVSIFKGSELVCVCVKDGYADKILSLLNGEK